MEGLNLNPENAKKIILNAVKTTEPAWREYGVFWKDIDYIFIQRGYEQGGFETSEFSKLLEDERIFSTGKLGQILDNFDFEQKYNREFAGGLDKTFYQDYHNNINFSNNNKVKYDGNLKRVKKIIIETLKLTMGFLEPGLIFNFMVPQ